MASAGKKQAPVQRDTIWEERSQVERVRHVQNGERDQQPIWLRAYSFFPEHGLMLRRASVRQSGLRLFETGLML